MPTTSNFGWTTPADTDLVKDGAAAIRTLGNGIDTSLVDLKGGTTGQVLTKATNADLDYTWTTPQVGDITEVAVSSPITGGGTSGSVTIGIQDATTAQKGAVQLTNSVSSTSTTTAATPSSVKSAYDLADAAIAKSFVNAKGDLISASANDTPAILTAGANGETLVADSSTTTGLRWQGNYAAGNNLVINGNMNIAQRGTSLTSLSTGETYLIDRFAFRNNNLGTATYSQETDAPAGFRTSARVLFTTADNTPAASDFSYFRYKFEGQQLQALQKGSATARPTTLSFWVKSNVTGNYVVNFVDSDNTRLICGSYTINSSATWEKKTITIPGDTTGALDNDNATSFLLDFALGAGTDRTSGTLPTTWGATVTANAQVGQVNVAATVNNYWMITGIQWEIGSVATEFNLAAGNGNIAGELAACQRYYWRLATGTNQSIGNFNNYSATIMQGIIQFPVTMRGTPTLDSVTGTDFYKFVRNGGSDTFNSFTLEFPNTTSTNIYNDSQISGTAGHAGIVSVNNASGYVGFSAEL